MLSRLYQLSGYKRAVAVWVGFMLILWGAFGIAALMHPNAFFGVEASPTAEGDCYWYQYRLLNLLAHVWGQ